MPQSATEIKETHNIDTNEGYIFFHFAKQDLENLNTICPEIVKPLPELPKNLSADWLPQKPDRYFTCQGSLMAIDSTQFTALIWR